VESHERLLVLPACHSLAWKSSFDTDKPGSRISHGSLLT
jgi:hypothetical protein